MQLVIMSIIALVSIAMNAILEKKTADKYSFGTQCFVKFGTSGLILLPFTRVFIEFSKFGIFVLSVTLFFQVTSVLIFHYLLSKTQVYKLYVFSKTTIIFSFIIDMILGTIPYDYLFLFYAFIFMLGFFWVLDFSKVETVKINKKIIFLLIMMIVLNLGKAYSKHFCLNLGITDNKTLVLLKSFLLSFSGLIFFKPQFNTISIKTISEYFVQCIFDVICNLSLNIVLIYSVFIANSVKGLASILIMILSAFMLKDKILKKQYVGITLASLGFVLMYTFKI